MELDIDFSPLEKLREKIGAERKDLPLAPPIEDYNREILEKLKKGIEIDVSDITYAGPFLTCEDAQVVLHIKDTRQTLAEVRNDKHNAKKFHIVWCTTLKTRHRRGGFERYVQTRNPDGIFLVDVFEDENSDELIETEEKLYVCQNCLEEINYNGFEDLVQSSSRNKSRPARRAAVEAFNLGEFLDEYEGVVRYLALPSGTAKTEPPAKYTYEFAKKSKIVKKLAKYCCKECRVNLMSKSRLLHCHHKDHNKSHNELGNLVAICAACHKNNHHPEMHVPRKDIREIERLREEQGIKE
ncbi:MAG: hypothetical protein ACR2M7_06060 [Bdellovibrionales bacterium]